MKSLGRLFSELDNLGVSLWVEEGSLRYRCQKVTKVNWKAEVAERKAEIIQFLNRSQHGQRNQLSIYHSNKPALLPLSFAQQRLWFFSQLFGNDHINNLAMVLELDGQLNTVSLELCLNTLVERHEALRTRIHTEHESPKVTINAHTPILLPIVDLSGLVSKQRDQEVERLAQRELELTFDLSCEPPFRVFLLKIKENFHTLLWTIHHIITDGWSNGVLAKEFGMLYHAFNEGRSSPLAKLQGNFSDYLIWQREQADKQIICQQLAYWKQQLDNAPMISSFISDNPRPPTRTLLGAHYGVHWDLSFVKKIRNLAKHVGVTPFIVLHTLLLVLMYRYSGNQDIIVAAGLANRTHRDLEPLVGFFLNKLMLRTRLEGNPTCSELLNRVKQTDLTAFANQDVVFAQVVEAVQPYRSLSLTSLAQVQIFYQNVPNGNLELPELKLSMANRTPESAAHDLALTIEELPEGLDITAEYDADLFERSSVIRMMQHMQHLTHSVLSNPEQTIDDVPLFSFHDGDAVIAMSIGSERKDKESKTFIDLFQSWVVSTPDALAVVCDKGQFTFLDMNTQVNLIAAKLNHQKLKPGSTVGVLADCSLFQLITMIAAFKCGFTFASLNLQYPIESLGKIITKGEISLIVVQQNLKENLEKIITNFYSTKKLAFLYEDFLNTSRSSTDSQYEVIEENISSTSEALAYQVFSSDINGNIKTTTITQQGVGYSLDTRRERLQLTLEDRLALIDQLQFNKSVASLLGSLAAGGCVNILSHDLAYKPKKLLAYIKQSGISMLEITPSTLSRVLSYLRRATEIPILPSLRCLVTSEKLLRTELAKEWFNFYPSVQLLNAYRPFIGAADEAFFFSLEKPSHNRRTLPVGKPMPNTSMYILGKNLELLPVGISGELFIQQDGLVRDYLNEPKLPTELFIFNPFGDDKKNQRLYRTGDIAVRLESGDIEILGRVDCQVKFRGSMIQLDEIESVLSNHEAVMACSVLLKGQDTSNEQLVAYIETGDDIKCLETRLRLFLKKNMADYLVPSRFIFVNKMPISVDGNIDTRKLMEREDIVEYVPPADDLEVNLIQLWQTVLGVEQVGVIDDFFELGGDSFLALRVIKHINKEFDLDLQQQTLFDTSNILELARAIRASE